MCHAVGDGMGTCGEDGVEGGDFMPNWYSDWQRQPTGNGRPRDPAVGEKILGAALELLAERGFKGTTVRAVAARAGVGAAAIYRRHENREEMMLAAIDESVGVREVENTGNTEMDLVSMLEVVRDSVHSGPGIRVLSAVLMESEEHSELLATYRRRSVWPRRKLIRSVLERAIRRGEIRDDLDLDAAVDMLWGSTFARFVTGSSSPVGTVGSVVKTLLDGLKRSERVSKFEMGYETVQ